MSPYYILVVSCVHTLMQLRMYTISSATDIIPKLLAIRSDGTQKYPLPLSFNDTFSIVSTLVTRSPSRVLLIILSNTLTGLLLSLNQPVVSAALSALLSKTTQLNTTLLPSQIMYHFLETE